MKESNTIRRIPPCAAYDVEGMESWLYDMAQAGLFLEKDGISCGIACFQRGEPRTVHYRLESARTDPTAMEVLISGDTMMGVDPDEEELEFHARYGWEYTGKRGMFYIYKNEREGPREMNTDPIVQAVSVNAVRQRRGWLAVSFLFVLLFNGEIYLQDVFPSLMEYAPGYLLALLFFLGCFAMGLVVEVLHLNRLYQKLNKGQGLNHRADWREDAPWYFIGRFLTIGAGVLWFLTTIVTIVTI